METNYFQRLQYTYSLSVLFFMSFSSFMFGFGAARNICTMYMYKFTFDLEPSQVQLIGTIFQLVSWVRIPISLVIDLKILKSRKYILFYSQIAQAVCCFLVMTEIAGGPKQYVGILLVDSIIGMLMVSIKDAIFVEQGRKDIEKG